MNKTSIIIAMSLVCILGLVYIVWSVNGTSISYLSEELELSSSRCVRIYNGSHYYYNVSFDVHNSGSSDISLVELYLDSKLVTSIGEPLTTQSISTNFKRSILRYGCQETINVYIDSDYRPAIMDRIKVSIITGSNKTYNLTAKLV